MGPLGLAWNWNFQGPKDFQELPIEGVIPRAVELWRISSGYPWYSYRITWSSDGSLVQFLDRSHEKLKECKVDDPSEDGAGLPGWVSENGLGILTLFLWEPVPAGPCDIQSCLELACHTALPQNC